MNAKIIKTRQALLDALCRLAETVPVNQITVTQLCQEAGINRTTFYRYYDIPTDVIVQKAEELMEETVYSKIHSMQDPYVYLLSMCNTYYENRKLIGVYLNASGDLFKLHYNLSLRHASKLQFLQDPVNNFVAGGVASAIMAWMIQGCTTPPEEVAKYLFDCISKLSNIK